jgi:hypothetical protein
VTGIGHSLLSPALGRHYDPSAVSGVSPLLSQLSVQPVAAFSSFRKLRSAQTYLFRARRDNNGAVQDIGADATTLEVDDALIASHCSGTTGRCQIWYDQTGNGWDITHPTPTATPVVYAGGAITRLLNKTSHVCAFGEALYRNDALGWSGDKSFTIVSAFKMNANNTMPWSIGVSTTNRAVYLIQDNTAGAGISLGYYNNGLRFTLVSAISNAGYYTVTHTVGGNTQTGTMRQNGTALAQHSLVGAAGTLNIGNTCFEWGGAPLPGGGFLSNVNGNFWIVFDQVLGAGDLALVEAEAARHVA